MISIVTYFLCLYILLTYFKCVKIFVLFRSGYSTTRVVSLSVANNAANQMYANQTQVNILELSPEGFVRLFYAFAENNETLFIIPTSPQSFIITFPYSLTQQLWELELNFDWLVKEVECPKFQPLIVIYRSGNFVYHHLGCTPIYRPLSYTFRSLHYCPWKYICFNMIVYIILVNYFE